LDFAFAADFFRFDADFDFADLVFFAALRDFDFVGTFFLVVTIRPYSLTNVISECALKYFCGFQSASGRTDEGLVFIAVRISKSICSRFGSKDYYKCASSESATRKAELDSTDSIN
jgi:hypothetical protein